MDKCPNDPEDKDGFEDADGCPDPDNDHDGIPDAKDKCPNEPETYNGYQDADGCPDRGRVIVTDSSIEILDQIYFTAKSAAIKEESKPILDATVATLGGNPSIKLVEIQGHAADNEPDALALSDRRAAAVRAYLIGHGLDARRVVPQGYGDTQPLDRAKTEAARAKNRRVGFLILKRDTGDEDEEKKAPVISTKTVAASTRTTTKPVEVAGAVRYELGEPVTVRRGSSTMVSIIGKMVTAEDAYLWRPDANAPGSDRHPFRAVRLVNSSGYTLQPGPIAIFARGTFVGDSLLDRLELDETAWIPYALDSGTTVTTAALSEERPVRLVALHKGVLTVENADVRVTKYTIAAGRQPAKQIYLRHARASGYTATDLPAGAIDQGDAYLVPVALSPAKTTELAITERQPRRRTVTLLDGRAGDLGVYLEGGGLQPALAGKLRDAIALRKDMATLEEALEAARNRSYELMQRSAEIGDSLRALDRVKNADELRKKLVASLAETTAKSDAVAKEVTAKSEALAAARAKLQDAIRDLALDEPKP
jgi:outer membrane protein OmpA-like peptidoglycan-associated protein